MIIKRKFVYQNSRGENIVFGMDRDFVIRHIEGIDTNETDLSTSKSVGQIGETVNNIEIKGKPITLDGFINKDELNNRYNMLNILTPGDKGYLACILETGDIYYLDAIVRKSPIIQNTDCKPNFQIELNAPYPFWQRSQSQSVTVQGLTPLFKYPRNTGNPSPWMFSKATEGELTYITNSGNYTVGMKITIKAKSNISNIKIQNANTLEYIAIKPSYVMQPNEVITITTGYNNKKIVSSINGNIIKHMDIDSTFLQLKPGANILKYTIDQDKNLSEVTLEFNEVKVGI